MEAHPIFQRLVLQDHLIVEDISNLILLKTKLETSLITKLMITYET